MKWKGFSEKEANGVMTFMPKIGKFVCLGVTVDEILSCFTFCNRVVALAGFVRGIKVTGSPT